jgi:outer membrane receptor protein involved in Fe transport
MLALALALGFATDGALAQDDADEDAERIIVTGSRVARSGFNAPNPVTVMGADLTEDLGIVNVGDTLRRLPQNTAFFTETNVGIGNFNVGSQLANLRGLNPFFGTRTLTLVDTRRVVPTTEGGAVDLTLIPSMLVARTEVVTGGATAAYGSDAIAGVVNVILDTELEGLKGQFDYGQTFRGDGQEGHAALAFGSGFAEDRGHVLLGIEYQSQNNIGPCSKTRDWCAESWAVGTNAAFNSPAGVGNGLPNFVVAPGAKLPTTNAGVIAPCLNAGCFPPGAGPQQQFNADGTALRDYDPGRFGGLFARIGGDGEILAYDHSNIRPEVERYSGLAHVSFEIAPALEAFGEVAYAHSDALSFPANGSLGPAGRPIRPDNAYLTPAVAAQIPNGGLLSRVFLPTALSARNTTENETIRFVAGLQGDLFSDWSWDAYYQYGRNENHQKLFNNTVGGLVAPNQYDFLGFAMDAVRSNPADPNSPIVCRATLPGPSFNPRAAGCVPINLFGEDNVTDEAAEYVFRTLQEDSEYTQHVVGANTRGTLFQGWAGPISAAAGVEWRRDEADTTHDIPNQPWYGSYVLSYGLDRGGEIEVLEGYAEVDVPLLRDLPFAQSLDVNLAARQTRNEATSSTSGDSSEHEFSSWKASAIYDVVDWLRFRGTLSRDVRAAGFRELFLPFVTAQGVPGSFPGGINNPWNNNVAEAYAVTTGGNPDLEPEEADTTTFGVVLSPGGALDGLQFSADWYEIDLGGAIAINPGAQQLVNACFQSNGASAACAEVSGFGTTDITAVDARAVNLGSFLTRGYDFEASYNLPLDRFHESLAGDVNLRVIASYLYDMIIDTGLGSPPINYHGQSGPVASFGGFNTSPDWRANAWLTYTLDRFSTTLEAQYVGDGTLNATWTESPPGDPSNTQLNTVTDNSVEDRVYFALSGSYAIAAADDGRSVEVFGVINNLFDEDPPVAPGGNLYPTNPVYFDTLGARFRAGVRITF